MLAVYGHVGEDPSVFADSQAAHLVIHENRVIGAHLVPGLVVEPDEMADGVRVRVCVREGAQLRNPVHLCFGVLPEAGLQRILLDVTAEPRSRVTLQAHCVFPNALDVTHEMEADIRIAEDARYTYFERHVHGPAGGVVVVPRARVTLAPRASFETEFELLEGRVGRMDIDYEARCREHSSLRMVARMSGSDDDEIRIREVAHLQGPGAAGVLLSRIAVKDDARADVYNELTASAPHAVGHVDCKEIVMDRAIARATPIVDVRHPLARVTHEASIGSVDSRQMETLMARGLTEEDAVDMIVRAMLSPARRAQEPASETRRTS
ncbi:MAG: SufBD protein [Candidatus Brocadiaceae bacterium]|nr:SufBD protein [Candidatus Brocadiaceae bacterium]